MNENLMSFEYNKFQKIKGNNSIKKSYKKWNSISRDQLYFFFYDCNKQLISLIVIADYYDWWI
jgi:hypothetical protein